MASLVELVDKFEPAPDKDHFGLITFNRKAVTEFTFSDESLYNKEKLKERIEKIPLTLVLQTRTDLAMKAARDTLFSPSGGDRPENPNVMIMLTDGKPTKQPVNFTVFADNFHKDPKVWMLFPSQRLMVLIKGFSLSAESAEQNYCRLAKTKRTAAGVFARYYTQYGRHPRGDSYL